MTYDKYVAADVHAATTTFCVRGSSGRVVSMATVETRPAELLAFVKAQVGRIALTFEEGTQAAWLYDLLHPHVDELVVCDPRQASKYGDGDKSDRIDALQLSDLLRGGYLKPVFHRETGMRHLKQLVMAYKALVGDHVRVQHRLQALFRGRGLPPPGLGFDDIAAMRPKLAQLQHRGLQHRAELLIRQLNALTELRKEAERSMKVEGRRHKACRLLQTVPGIGPVRSAQLVAVIQTPHRFRTKRQLWKYAGLAVVHRSTSDYEQADGEMRRRKTGNTRGLNRNHNPMVKDALKGAAFDVSCRIRGPLHDHYTALTGSGLEPSLARVTLARKLGAIILALWKKGEPYDADKVTTRV